MNISWQPGGQPAPRYERGLYEALWRYGADAQDTILAAQMTLSRLDPRDNVIEAAQMLGPGESADLTSLGLDAGQTELILTCGPAFWPLAPYLVGRLICANPRFVQEGLSAQIELRARFVRKFGPDEFSELPGRTLSLAFDTSFGPVRARLQRDGEAVTIVRYDAPVAMPCLAWREILTEDPVARGVRDLLRSKPAKLGRQNP